MALQIYPAASHNSPFSQAGANTSPVRFSVDGRIGAVIERLYYLANENNTSFTSVTLQPIASVANDIVNGEDGYSVKLKAGSAQPTAQEWDTIEEGNEVAMANIPNDQTFLPFWIRVEVPRGASVETVLNTKLRIDGIES